MLADLVEVTTPDGIGLAGAYFAPAEVDRGSGVDAVLFFHGDCGNFYGRLYLGLGQRMGGEGIAFVSANRRGHDHVSGGAKGGPLAGYAFESVDDSRADFGAWLGLLRERGHRRIAIGGHSGGAVRAVYAQARESFDNVVGVIAVSPGEYDHEGIIALHGEDFSGPFRESESKVAEGRADALLRPGVPWGSTWSAGGVRGLLQPGQQVQRDGPRGGDGVSYAVHFRRRGVFRWRAAGAAGGGRGATGLEGRGVFSRAGADD